MRDSDKTSRKYISQSKKLSVSERTRSDNPSSISTKEYRDDPMPIFSNRGMKNLGRKYVQQNCFKVKEKEYHEIVISDELVRKSKMFRMLKEKMEINEAIYIKETAELRQIKEKIAKQTTEKRQTNHHSKLTLWELKNQILELKGILNDEEEEHKRLEVELHNSQQYEQEEEAQNQMPEDSQKPLHSEADFDLERDRQQEEMEKECERMRQEEVDIRMMMMQLHKKMKVNPENQKQEEESEKKEEEQGAKREEEEQEKWEKEEKSGKVEQEADIMSVSLLLGQK